MNKKEVIIPAKGAPREIHPIENLGREIRKHDIKVQIEAYERMIEYCREQIDALRAEMDK